MKVKIKKETTIEGQEVNIPVIYEKNDEFYIFSKLCLKKLSSLTSVRAIHLFFAILSFNRYNDDRVQLRPKDKHTIMKNLNLDRVRLWKLTKMLIEAGLLFRDDDELRIPANLAFYGERKTKQMLVRSYAAKQLQVNQNFETNKSK